MLWWSRRPTFDIRIAILGDVLAGVGGARRTVGEAFGQHLVLVLEAVVGILVALHERLKQVCGEKNPPFVSFSSMTVNVELLFIFGLIM